MNKHGESPTVGKFPLFNDERGSLGVAEFAGLPFVPRRFFWISDVRDGDTRANHGHRECAQLVFVQQGSVSGFTLDADGERFEFELSAGGWVHVPVRHWLQLNSFSPRSVVGVFASQPFNADEYIDDPSDLNN